MELIDEIILPKSWQELVALKNILPFCTSKVTKFIETTQAYDDYKKSISQEKNIQNILNSIGDQDLKIIPNKFPYLRLIQYISGVEHYCLWSKKGEPSLKDIDFLIKKEFPTSDYFWFVNPPNNKSIPEIWHCQLFIKKS